ncbi:MAG: hypothetical protein LBR30_02120 [Clostridioides sp.]|nr:hypothetical protein [Clostridioides sp.]
MNTKNNKGLNNKKDNVEVGEEFIETKKIKHMLEKKKQEELSKLKQYKS